MIKSKIEIKKEEGDFWAEITVEHPFIEKENFSKLVTISNKHKGEIKRKAIQFCAALNLEAEFVE
jgi:hypothetical protein